MILDEQHADDAFAFADGSKHRRGGIIIRLGRLQEFCALVNDAANERVGCLWLRRRRHLSPLPFKGRYVEQGKNLVSRGVINIESKIIPTKKLIGSLANDHRRLRRRRGRAQSVAQL